MKYYNVLFALGMMGLAALCFFLVRKNLDEAKVAPAPSASAPTKAEAELDAAVRSLAESTEKLKKENEKIPAWKQAQREWMAHRYGFIQQCEAAGDHAALTFNGRFVCIKGSAVSFEYMRPSPELP